MIGLLRNMVAQANCEEISTVEALCVRLTEDFVAGMVLHRLLLWAPKSRRPDGAIWKSDREWGAELGLSPDQMARAREKLAGLVEVWLEKAYGAPTNHYLVLTEAVIERSRGLLGVSISGKAGNGFPGKPEMDFRETQESITTESPTESPYVCVDTDIQTEPVVMDEGQRLLMAVGVSEPVAADVGRLPVEVIRAIIQSAEEKQLLNPAGWIVAACRRKQADASLKERARLKAQQAMGRYQESKYADFIETGVRPIGGLMPEIDCPPEPVQDLAEYFGPIRQAMRPDPHMVALRVQRVESQQYYQPLPRWRTASGE